MANEGATGGFVHAAPANSDKLPVVRSIFDFSAEALGDLRTWLEQNPPAVTIQSIIGFSQFTAQVASDVLTEETRNVITYGDLATVGPSLSGLSDGKYLLLFGCTIRGGNAGGFMAPSINGAAASDSQAALGGGGTSNDTSVMRIVAASLSSGNNSVVMKYRSQTGGLNTSILYRWLLALRYSSL